ncbi:YhdT family protein [Candidatus Pacearchaeota archaeon]|jgi:sulfur carrier protein ThiS|nr:YhdT family protein [Candidatus Pacearchaeota archaeon]
MGLIPPTFGPFDTRHLLIGLLVLICTYAAMFVLAGFLSFGFVFPIWMFISCVMTVIVIIAVLFLTIFGYMRWGPEGFLFAKARKTGLAVAIDTELGSSKAEFVLMEKENPKDVVLKDEEAGIKVDPAMLDSNCKPMSFPLGLDIYIFTFYNYMSQSIQNHAAFKVIEEDFQNNPKRDILRFLSIKEYSELLSDPEHYLERNALIKLNKYFTLREAYDEKGDPVYTDEEKRAVKMTHVRRYNAWIDDLGQDGKPIIIERNGEFVPSKHWGLVEEDITLSEMMQALHEARHDINKMPIPGGLIAGTEAFKYNSVAYSSQHLSHVLMLYYSKIIEDLKGKVELLTYGIVAMMILVGGAVAIYVISMAFQMFSKGAS